MAVTNTTINLDGLPTLDSGAPVPVLLDHVEEQFHGLWRNVAETAQSKLGDQAVMMAQVLNLIVRAESYDAANDYTADIDQITGRHPGRAIMTIIDPTDEQMALQAWVSIHCQLPPTGGRQVCCEQVTVAGGGDAAKQMPAAIIPLLLSELPVFLWWPRGTPFDDNLFKQLADSLNRLIVDSATFENPEGALSRMAERLRSSWPHLSYTDMNWGRLTRWRELVAQFFDSAALRPYLDRITDVTIDVALSKAGTSVNRAQGLLAAGWLASRLGWHPVDPVYQLVSAEGDRPSSTRLSLKSGKRSVTVLVNAGPWTCDVPGDIQSIKLEVAGSDGTGEAEATFRVSLDQEHGEQATTSIDIKGTTPTVRNIQLESLTRAELLDNELEVFSHDKVYEEALDIAGAFIRGNSRRDQPEGPRKLSGGEPMSAGTQRPRPSTDR